MHRDSIPYPRQMALALCIFWVVFVTCGTASADQRIKRPNILLIMADDVGMGDIGCFGNRTMKTPHIDRLARQGARLTHNLAAASVCTPSRSAFLTGRYPIRSGMVPTHIVRVNVFLASQSGLPQNETTIAKLAQSVGYKTAIIGKWHLGVNCETFGDNCHHPLNHGFDYFYGIPLTNLKDFSDDPNESSLKSYVPFIDQILLAIVVGGLGLTAILKRTIQIRGLSVALLLFLFIVLPLVFYVAYNNWTLLNSVLMRNYDYVEQPIRFMNLTQRFVQEGKDFIQESVNADKPFLLLMSWAQAHTVLHTSREFKGHSVHGEYGDNVEEMDWAVGEILSYVSNNDLEQDTLVYFTSDNGAHLEERTHGGNNGIYRGGKCQGGMEGGIRVPTVIKLPGVVPAGAVISEPTSLLDVLPTLAGVAGFSVPTDRAIDGRDLLPLLRGRSHVTPHHVMMHYCGNEIHAVRIRAREGNAVYKAHYAIPNFLPGMQQCRFVCGCYGHAVVRQDPPIIYNIADDPSEKSPIDPNSKKHKRIRTLLQRAIDDHRATLRPVPNQYAPLRLLWRPSLQPCCNFPKCNCADTVYSDLYREIERQQ